MSSTTISYFDWVDNSILHLVVCVLLKQQRYSDVSSLIRTSQRFEKECQFFLTQAHSDLAHRSPDHIDQWGNKIWYDQKGYLHRDLDLPALIGLDGHQEWFIHGERHRDHDRPAIESKEQREWFIHGKRHRDHDQPAVIAPFYETWWINGQKHRENGFPARICIDGFKEWYVHGKIQRSNLFDD